MAESLVQLVRTLRAALVGFQPGVYSGEDCAVLVEELATTEKACAAARPIPVSLARELGRDAFLKAVLHDGVKIDAIAHFGRKYPAVLRTMRPRRSRSGDEADADRGRAADEIPVGRWHSGKTAAPWRRLSAYGSEGAKVTPLE